MHRRRFLAGLGAVSAATALAGCTVHLPKPGEPELETTAESSGFVGDGFQPTIVVTGEVSNVGPVYVKRARLTARLVDGNGEDIDSRSTVIEKLEREETQQFSFTFPVSATDVSSFDHVEIDVTFPERES